MLTPMIPLSHSLSSSAFVMISVCLTCTPIGMKLVKECIECAMQVAKMTVLLVEEIWTAWNCFPSCAAVVHSVADVLYLVDRSLH